MGRRGVKRDIIQPSRVEPQTTDALQNMIVDQGHKFVLWFGEQSWSQGITIRYSITMFPERMMKPWNGDSSSIFKKEPQYSVHMFSLSQDELPLKNAI